MGKPVVAYKGTVKADTFEGNSTTAVGAAIEDGEDTVVLATDSIAEALQKIVDWVDAEFTRSE